VLVWWSSRCAPWPCATRNSSLGWHRNDARTAENGFAKSSGVNQPHNWISEQPRAGMLKTYSRDAEAFVGARTILVLEHKTCRRLMSSSSPTPTCGSLRPLRRAR